MIWLSRSPKGHRVTTASGEPRRDQGRHWAGLMCAAQDAAAAAYGALPRDLPPVLRILARRQVTRPDNVEDVVQDVLLTIHRVRHNYDPSRPLLPWGRGHCH